MFADNFFASLPLVEYLKSEGIWYTGTIRTTRSKKFPLLAEKDLKLKASGSFEYHIEQNRKIDIAMCFGKKVITLTSSYVGVESTDALQHQDFFISSSLKFDY